MRTINERRIKPMKDILFRLYQVLTLLGLTAAFHFAGESGVYYFAIGLECIVIVFYYVIFGGFKYSAEAPIAAALVSVFHFSNAVYFFVALLGCCFSLGFIVGFFKTFRLPSQLY
jgi:hypothetical protein